MLPRPVRTYPKPRRISACRRRRIESGSAVLSQPARKNAAVDPHIESAAGSAVSRGKKVPVFLVTLDETLWPHIGQKLDSDCVFKQVDSIEELQRTSRTDQSGVVIWD